MGPHRIEITLILSSTTKELKNQLQLQRNTIIFGAAL